MKEELGRENLNPRAISLLLLDVDLIQSWREKLWAPLLVRGIGQSGRHEAAPLGLVYLMGFAQRAPVSGTS